jgi:pimeloyl-ACP methyl ester carboxylesterase/predicted glycosyltransferase
MLRAREPDETGFVERDGVSVYWERLGDGDQTVLFLPTWTLLHSRCWKMQLPYFSRHYRVLTFDPRGNGKSDRPSDPAAYAEAEFAGDALAVMDATGTDQAAIVGLSMGAQRGLLLAADHPERVASAAFIGPAVPLGTGMPERKKYPFDERHDTTEGWAKSNRYHWVEGGYEDYVEFFFSRFFTEPHSTKGFEDCVAWGLETTGEILVATYDAPAIGDRQATLEVCARVQCPVLVIHGEDDAIISHSAGAALAEATRGTLVTLEGSGHGPNVRDPVKVNLLLRDFIGDGERPAERRIPRTMHRKRPRALYVSSPIGLGHAQRDLAIARELRKLRPDLEIDWLAQHPVTKVLEAAGERIHPASKLMANESAHIESEMGEHDLHVFQAWREMDEILLANFMLFHDVVRDDRYDLWLGDESWEVDYYLHENPELKNTPYVFMTDFVGWLPIDDSAGSREAFVAADYNHENIRHIERYPYVRDGALFVGSKDDVVPRHFGPELPFMPDWIESHFDFAGYVLPFDPAEFTDTERLRAELGYDPKRPLIVAAVGGSGVGVHLLRRIAAAFGELRKDVPEARLLLVCGPRIDPRQIEPVEGMEAVGYVHDLFRTLACCDLAVVQGGLTTTMELVANRRPFVYIPLQNHFEQNHHVVHRLRRYGAPAPTFYDEATPDRLAAQMLERLGAEVDYEPVESDGAARAAAAIAPLLEERKGGTQRAPKPRRVPASTRM